MAEAREEGRDRGAKRAVAAVLALQGNAESLGAGGAEEPFRADFRGPAGQGPHQLRVGPAGAADELRVRPHRGRDPAASLAGFEPREHERDPLEREREADYAAAVDCRLELAGLELGGGRDFGQDLILKRMAGKPVPLGLPAPSPARGEHAGVLAGAVVEDRLRRTALLDPDLEVVLGRGSLREQPSDSL